MHPHALQKIHENEEMRTAMGLLELGTYELKNIGGGNDFYHLPLLLLSNGLERLMKVILCIDYYQEHGDYPDSNYLKNKLGHKLTNLLGKILPLFEKANYLQIPVAKEDGEFLKNDNTIKLILEALENYASGGRYHDLDAMLVRKETDSDPKHQWEKIETHILQSFPNWERYIQEPSLFDEMWKKINHTLIEKLSRLIRAFCRLFTMGPIAKEGKIHCGQISTFLFLNDDELAIGPRNIRGKNLSK